ncbi:MAG TPA: LTA synthase family protein [Verrucomicrobiae bacterium]|nr:LTA synthase family protein [Verrucomicrobiae bacterium]
MGAATTAGPVQIGSRLIVLLAGLGIIKLILLATQGESLFEAHWRINGNAGGWLNYVVFYAFVVLGGLAIVKLGGSVRQVTPRAARTVNLAVLILGLTFIFLTFHNGDKNYLYPVFNGVLKWTSLVPYIANSLFFNQPFLAAWIFVYAAVYYVLARTGREQHGFWLTAVFGCVYALGYLQELMVRRDELLIVDCLGAIALCAWWLEEKRGGHSPTGLSRMWLLAPVSWTLVFGIGLLRFEPQWMGHPSQYFLGLIAAIVLLFAVTTALIRRVGDPPGWNWMLPFCFAGFLLLTDTNYPAAENYNHVLCLSMTMPRYFIGELIVTAVLGLLAWGYRRVHSRGSFAWLDIACLGLLLLAAVDLRLSQIMGVRLGWDVLSFGDSPKMMLKLARPYLPGLIAGVAVLGALYVLAVRAIQLWFRAVKGTVRGSAGESAPADAPKTSSFTGGWYVAAMFSAMAFVGLGFAESDKAQGDALGRLVRSSPLWKRVANRTLGREEFLKSASALGLGNLSAAPAAPAGPPRNLNVLVVFMESSYNKHLSLFGSSEETQPLLAKYRDRMELFPNFFSAFAGSIHARFATFTSLYPVSDFHAFTQERVPVKSFFEILHDQGYSCSMFYSSYFDYTDFRDFLKNRGLDEMYDADTMPGQRGTDRVEWGLLEEETLGAIRSQLKRYAQEHRRFCLTYVPAAPHYPYDKIPKPFRKYKMKEVGDFTPLYLNELLYMDWVISSIVDQLKESGLLDNTLVVITNDHGEMLGGKEDGHIGHGWAMTPELGNTPLILMDPARPGYQINRTIGTQVDFLPTVLDRLNIPLPADELYEGRSLDRADARGRRGYLNTYKQFGIIDGDKILLGDRESNSPNGTASRGAVFSIGNDGAKTVFTESPEANSSSDRQADMARFDAFQASLLRNYASYRSSVHGAKQQLAKRTEK